MTVTPAHQERRIVGRRPTAASKGPEHWPVVAALAICTLTQGCTMPSRNLATKPRQEPNVAESAAITPGEPAPADPADASMPEPLKPTCTPQCAGRKCGDDGCGGHCGTCKDGLACVEKTGRCVACANNDCDCEPNCNRRVCGDDGCGGSCGECEDGSVCDDDHGLCKMPTCGNGMVEGQEECDGDDFCKPDCTRLTPEQSACLVTIEEFANPDCFLCGCTLCTDVILACTDSGDLDRDAACGLISRCAADEMCFDTDCICGTQRCMPANGPCLKTVQDAVGTTNPRIILNCYQDSECAVYRSKSVGECIRNRCPDECGYTRPSTEPSVPDPAMPPP
jgi:hypothetical protein